MLLGFLAGRMNLLLYGAIALLAVSFFGYYYWAQSKIKYQQNIITAHEISLKIQKDTIDKLDSDYKKSKELNQKLTKAERDAAANAAKLSNDLIDLQAKIKTDPETALKTINQNEALRRRCIELAAGSKPNKKEVNSLCPHLLLKL